jgi:hypothetical protein
LDFRFLSVEPPPGNLQLLHEQRAQPVDSCQQNAMVARLIVVRPLVSQWASQLVMAKASVKAYEIQLAMDLWIQRGDDAASSSSALGDALPRPVTNDPLLDVHEPRDLIGSEQATKGENRPNACGQLAQV